MRVIARSTLRNFWERHSDTENALRAWYQDTAQAQWKTPEDIKSTYASASVVAGNRVVFNIKGNQYRLIVAVNYPYGIVYIRFVGSHQDYDKVDAATVRGGKCCDRLKQKKTIRTRWQKSSGCLRRVPKLPRETVWMS